ncbi:MAG: VOC family protein [Candidatus Acidiferrum sp.]|jgi:PhnB protein
MPDKVRPIPEGYHSISPAITCKNAASAIEFYKEAFGATEMNRMSGPGGTVMHAELCIGDSVIFVSDEWPGMAAAPTPGAIPSSYLFLYAPDVDTVFQRAIAAGATAAMPVTDMFWGDRYGKITDPFGHSWGIATHVEDVSPDEIARRSAEWTANAAKASEAAAAAGQS